MRPHARRPELARRATRRSARPIRASRASTRGMARSCSAPTGSGATPAGGLGRAAATAACADSFPAESVEGDRLAGLVAVAERDRHRGAQLLLLANRAQRRGGQAQLDLARLAAGHAEGLLAQRPKA